MKQLILATILLTTTFSVNADISGGSKCKSALLSFDASHNAMAKLAVEIGRSSTLKKSKARELIDTLNKAIESGNAALSYCTITGNDKTEFDGYHNMAKSTLAFYKSQGLLDKLD